MTNKFEELIKTAARHPMTDSEREDVRLEFVYGNCSLSNPNITRELVREVDAEMKKARR